MGKECVIYDDNEDYGKRLMNAVSMKAEAAFGVQLFTRKQELENYLGNNEPDVMLVSETSYYSELLKIFGGRLIVLTEEVERDDQQIKRFGDNAFGVYRYQSLDRIYKQIVEQGNLLGNRFFNRTDIIGIYTPVMTESRTIFSLNLARYMAEKYKTLYINFEEFSGLSELLPSENDSTLSDTVYYFRQAKETSADKIRETIFSKDGVDYIAPVRCAEDIGFMDAEQIVELIHFIANAGGYEVVIVDISSAIRQPWKLVSSCNRVYMPVMEDYISKWKIQELETYFCGCGVRNWLDIVEKVRVPEVGNINPQDFWLKIGNSGMYRFVKSLEEKGGN